MNTLVHVQRSLCVLITLLMASSSVLPQVTAGTEPPSLEQLAKVIVDRTCTKQAADLIGALDAKLIFEGKKPDIAQVCSCTEQGLVRDPRLVEHWAIGAPGRAQRLNSQQSKVYFTTRLYQALYACVAAEVDRGLASFILPK